MLNLLPRRTLGIAAATVLVAAVPAAFDALALDRSATLAGEPWRLLTGHLVHATGYHLAWNVGPLLVLGLLFEPVLRQRLWLVIGASSLVIGAGMLLLSPGSQIYCGLSGVLNGILVGGALLSARRDRESGSRGSAALTSAVVFAALAKIAVEAWSGAAVLTDPSALGGHSVPLAHALGALGGLAAIVPVPGTAWPRRFGEPSLPAAYCKLHGSDPGGRRCWREERSFRQA